MAEQTYEPISFEDWKRANPELCQEWPCGECDGSGAWVHENEIGDPPADFEEHPEPEFTCPYCVGGIVSEASANYLVSVRADREKWERFTGLSLDAIPAGGRE
jgi:hypothetical protein